MDDFYKNLGQLIRQKRLEKNCTTEDLAKDLNVSKAFISYLENAKGTDTFNIKLMMKLHETLGISLLCFFPVTKEDLHLNPSAVRELGDTPNHITDLVSNNIDTIINAYISVAKNHNFDPGFINKITDKLLYELNYIDEL